jgi:outer membrane protein OmpA-like peptidoglycan-associated protein
MSNIFQINFVSKPCVMNIKFLLSFLLLLNINFHSLAQDARISQIWSMPTMMNPALCGNIDGKLLIGTGYSNQSTNLSSVGHLYAFANARLSTRRRREGEFIGIGGSYYQYGANGNNAFDARFSTLTASYHFNLSADGVHSAAFGTQFVFAQGVARGQRASDVYDKEINGGGFRWTNAVYNTTTPGTISMPDRRAQYFDWNSGVSYRYSGDNIIIDAGVGGYHYLHPKNSISVVDFESRLRGRLTFQTAMTIALDDLRSLYINNIFWKEGLYWRSTALDANNLVTNWSGIEFKRHAERNSFYADFGIYTRSFKTALPYLSLYSPTGLNLRMSFEFPFNSKYFEAYTAKRLELALRYTLYKDKNPKEITAYTNADYEKQFNDEYVKRQTKQQQVIINTDSDGDGIVDGFDKCPTQPGTIANNGCPVLDRDHDGVMDQVDACPDVAGTVRNGGCPELQSVIPVERKSDNDTLRYSIYFETGESFLSTGSFEVMDKVLTILKNNETYSCTLYGHADVEGTPEKNLLLSRRRAEVAKNYLQSYGVTPDRISTFYMGDSKQTPIYQNELKWMNRRVEIVLVKKK